MIFGLVSLLRLIANENSSLSLLRETAFRRKLIPPRLVHLVAKLFPGSTHVRDIGLASANDQSVWTYAFQHDFIIVSKDSDFHQRSFVEGAPPKVIWLRCGNCDTQEISKLLQNHRTDCERFANDPQTAFLEIG